MHSPPDALFVLDPDNSDQRQLFERFIALYGQRLSITAAVTSESQTQSLPCPTVATSNPRYQYHLRTARILVTAEPQVAITRFNHRQHCFSVTSAEAYCSVGLQVKSLRPALPYPRPRRPFDVGHGLVYGASADERASVGHQTISFSSASSALEAMPILDREISAVLDRLTPTARRYFLFLPSAADISRFPDWLIALLQECVDRDDADVTVVSTGSPTGFETVGLPHTHVIHPRIISRAYPSGPLDDDTFVVFSDTQDLSTAGLMRSGGRYLMIENLRLLDACTDVIDHELLGRLAQDPTGFHVATLDGLYRQLGCEQYTVSIIIPHYNTPIEKLVRAVNSALRCRSSHERTEILLIDDGSALDVEPELRQILRDEWSSIRLYRKDNEGLGPTRNFGVRHATGEYVFFLDSDDEIVSENLARLLAHGVWLGSECVTGKRLLYDQDGRFLRDSLDYTFRGVARQVDALTLNIYDDQMANNRLLKRSALIDHELWFEPGYYEDNVFATRLYSELDGIEFLNLPIHRWYQYGPGESITKTASFAHIRDKLASLERSWGFLADAQRRVRVLQNLNKEFPIFLRMAEHLPEQERRALTEQAAEYLRSRRSFVDDSMLTAEGDSVVRRLESEISLAPPDHGPSRVEAHASRRRVTRHFFFPRTHFQVLEAMAFTLEHDATSIIVVLESAAGFTPRYLHKLSTIGVFSEIVRYQSTVIADCLGHRVRLGSGADPAIISTLLESLDNSLPELNSDDVGVFFTEGLPEVYAIKNRFAHVFKFEDGYRSTNREFVLNRSDGIWGVTQANSGVWGPLNIRAQHACRSLRPEQSDIERMYVNTLPDEALLTGEYANASVVLEDFREVALRHRGSMLAALTKLYGRLPSTIQGGSVVLTQPLFFSYCSMREHIIIVLELVRLAGGGDVYVKPHPMDPVDYAAAGFRVLPGEIPFEYFELAGARFQRAVSFGSSAVEGSRAVDEVVHIFPLEGFKADDVRDEIRRICSTAQYSESLVQMLVDDTEMRNATTGSQDPRSVRREKWERWAKQARTAGRLLRSDRGVLAKTVRLKVAQALHPG